MPQTVFLEDGTEIEVPTQEEFDAQLEQKVGETKVEYENRIKELESEINPNWREARQTIKNLREAVAKKGGKVDENGQLTDERQQIDLNVIEERAREAARKELISSEIQNRLNQYSENDRDVVKGYFEKLSAGENLNLGNIDKFIEDAEKIAFGSSSSNNTRNGVLIRGSAPSKGVNQETFDTKPEGKDLMNKMGLKASQEK